MGARRVRFGDTMIMSTYLVAVVVGPFEPDRSCRGGRRADHRRARTGQGAPRATSLSRPHAHSIRFFTEWFEIPYPAAKLDLIALPDFAMGAMENLGCVTFRESALLVDPAHASLAELQPGRSGGRPRDRPHVVRGPRDDALVGRNLAQRGLRHSHGDHVRGRLPPGVGSVDGLRHHARAGHGDRRDSTPPVPSSSPVGKPEEAEAMFDPLTYEKGAGVLRMLERYIGAEQFRDGIRLYLKRHSLREHRHS